MRHVWILGIALAGCAAHDDRLQARVHDLELQVAELRGEIAGARSQLASSRETSSRCQKTFKTTFADSTQITDAVPFAIRDNNLHDGDVIAVDEVRGTVPRFEVGGVYRVRGHYTLASAAEAELGFTTMTQTAGYCATSSGRDSVMLERGSGTFELTTTIPYEGFPHLSFFIDHAAHGGVVFGKTAGVR